MDVEMIKLSDGSEMEMPALSLGVKVVARRMLDEHTSIKNPTAVDMLRIEYLQAVVTKIKKEEPKW